MNVFLLIVILAVGGGGFYEYTQQQQVIMDNQQKLSDLTHKVDDLTAENKKLTDDQGGAAKAASDAQAKITDLTSQLAAAQALLDAAKQKTTETASAAPAAPAAPADPNDLGDLKTLDGKTYAKAELLKIDGDGITISHDGGAITKILFGLLNPDMQSKFGYDAHKAADLTAAQLKFQQQNPKAGPAPGDD